jgi:hypothetical protein
MELDRVKMEARTPGGMTHYEKHRRLSITVDRYRVRARRDSGTRARGMRSRSGHLRQPAPERLVDVQRLTVCQRDSVAQLLAQPAGSPGGHPHEDSMRHSRHGPGGV